MALEGSGGLVVCCVDAMLGVDGGGVLGLVGAGVGLDLHPLLPLGLGEADDVSGQVVDESV